MNYLRLIDYYPMLEKNMLNIEDVMLFFGCSRNYAILILKEIIESTNDDFTYYQSSNNLYIPTQLLLEHYSFNRNRLRQYHNSLNEFLFEINLKGGD